MLDFLDRMPAPHALRLGIGARKVRRVGQDSVREDRGKMFERAGRGELHDRRSPLRPGDGASGAVLGRDHVVARVARLPVEEDMRSEEHTSELQSLMRISYAVFCLKKKKQV